MSYTSKAEWNNGKKGEKEGNLAIEKMP
jgi:hypothetical protein